MALQRFSAHSRAGPCIPSTHRRARRRRVTLSVTTMWITPARSPQGYVYLRLWGSNSLSAYCDRPVGAVGRRFPKFEALGNHAIVFQIEVGATPSIVKIRRAYS